MENKAFNILKSRYARAYNRLVRQHIRESVVNKLFLKQIKMGLLPEEFLICFNLRQTRANTVKKARQRFNTNWALKNRVLKKFGYKCCKCGVFDRLEIDHIVPILLRPDLACELSNLQVLCVKCHDIKHSTDR